MRRFWEKVNKEESGCWLWVAGKDVDGYGRFRLDGRSRLAHVVAWELVNRRIVPTGKCVHHVSTCRNRLCVRPDHLTIGVQADAIRARNARGNGPAGERNAAAKLTAARVAQLRAEHASGAPSRELAARYGVHQTVVTDIVAGRLWAHTMPPAPAAPATGRPAREFDRLRAEEMRRGGMTIRAIAEALGVPRSTVADSFVRKADTSDNDLDNDARRFRPFGGPRGR